MKNIQKKALALLLAGALTLSFYTPLRALAEGDSALPSETPTTESGSSSSEVVSSEAPTPTSTPTTEPTPTPTSTPSEESSSASETSEPQTPEPTATPSQSEETISSEEESSHHQTVADVDDQSSEESSASSKAPKKNIVSRPKATIKPNFSTNANTEPETKKESNYVTFVTLNLKQNTLSQKLFTAGCIFIVLGVAGLIVLIFLHLRAKRRGPPDNGRNKQIFDAIQEAEDRSRGAQNMYADVFQDYTGPIDGNQNGYAANPNAYQQNSYANQPQPQNNDNYYNAYNAAEQYAQTEQAQYLAEDPYMQYDNPPAATYYDDYDNYDTYNQDYAPQQAIPQQPVAQQPVANAYVPQPVQPQQPVAPNTYAPQPVQPQQANYNNPPSRPATYDTEEIMREALGYHRNQQ